MPGPGIHGGKVLASGPLKKILATKESLTGQFLSGKRETPVPSGRRRAGENRFLIQGARENNLRIADVQIPLQQFVCITGDSGSGRSSLLHEVLYKKLRNFLEDSRVPFFSSRPKRLLREIYRNASIATHLAQRRRYCGLQTVW